MAIKVGNIVSHEGVLEWGAGKVLEVKPAMVTVQFSDGRSRKIASSHFSSLHPAEEASYIPPAEAAPVLKVLRTPRLAKKKK
jgi:hypothetical protein